MDAPLSASRSLLLLIGGGVVLRLLLAYVIFPSAASGDVMAYARWAEALIDVGPRAFYETTQADYPPGYLYVLWLVGALSKGIASAVSLDTLTIARWLVKVPPILLDGCAGLMLHDIARRWLSNRAASARMGFAAAAIYVLNPVTIYDSAIWGQTDAAGACIVLAALMALTRGPPELSALIAVVAGLIKPQYGVILLPLVSAVLVSRHLLGKRPEPAGGVSEKIRWSVHDGPIRLLTAGLVSIFVFYVLTTPFNIGLRSFVERMTVTASQYHFLSVNAFNPWSLVGSGAKAPLAFAGIIDGGAHLSDDTIPLIGSISGVTLGSALLALGILIGVGRILCNADRWSIVLVGTYLSLCFFMLPTRVHERYAFTAFAFIPLLAVVDRKWLLATVLLAIASFMNLHGVLSVVVSLPGGAPLRSVAGIITSVSLHTAVFLFLGWSLRNLHIYGLDIDSPADRTRPGGPDAKTCADAQVNRSTSDRPANNPKANSQ